MSTPLLPEPGGRTPERGGSLSVQAEETKMLTVEEKMRMLQREISIRAFEFMSTVDYTNPFNLCFMESENGNIAERAVLKTLGAVDLSAVGSSQDELYKEREGMLIREFIEAHSKDLPFREGVKIIKDWISISRPFIEGRVDYHSQPNGSLSIQGITLPYTALDFHLTSDPIGISLIKSIGGSLQSFQPEKATGFGFGVDLFVAAATEYTEQRISELTQLQKAKRFLDEQDELLARFAPSYE